MWELQFSLHLHQAKEKKSPSTGSRVSYVPIKKQSTSGNLKFISFKRQAHLGGFFNTGGGKPDPGFRPYNTFLLPSSF